ncbi:MAG: hypothetical protein P8X55_10145 [Desulfosarcinaceae bacterium]
MIPGVNYKALVEELRDRLTSGRHGPGEIDMQVRDKFRCRLACMLDVDSGTPVEVLLDQLVKKWEQDGLL